MKDFELRYVAEATVEVLQRQRGVLYSADTGAGSNGKNWQSKRPQTGRDVSANVKLM